MNLVPVTRTDVRFRPDSRRVVGRALRPVAERARSSADVVTSFSDLFSNGFRCARRPTSCQSSPAAIPRTMPKSECDRERNDDAAAGA